MTRLALILPLMQLAAASLLAQEFSGQVGRIDEELLDENWYKLGPGEFPIIPLQGVRVKVIDCQPDCPIPVHTDSAGWFSIPDLPSPARLQLEAKDCPVNDFECEPLEPREVEVESGARTALGAKWPDGISDTMLRYMPLVAGALYVTRSGEIPLVPGAAGSASRMIVWSNGRNSGHPYGEKQTFLHELMHLYERRVRQACWYENQEVNGLVLHESWLVAYDADRALLQESGQPLRERDGYEMETRSRAAETLADFTQFYFIDDALTLEWRKDRIEYWKHMTHDELEQYAPHRYEWFELMVFGRYFDQKSYQRANPGASTWPGMCLPPERLAWALDRLPPLPQLSKTLIPDPPGFKCGLVDLH
ncbi:MAG: hypothetical protein OXL36_16695 [Bryobacterales bacterium]|nr:hypothetical protein [Bryobacterales bacterium]MDE0296118.1 hypothetical protein [Bryobacterales bacterium]